MPDRHAGENENYAGRDLDAILDEALAAYANAEPDPSLRVRITVAAESTRSHIWNGRLVGLGAACACAAAFAFLWMHHAPVISSPAPVVQRSMKPAASSPAVERNIAAGEVSRRTHHARRNRQAMPKLAVFPAPSPLTPTEEAWMSVAESHSAAVSRAFAPVQKAQAPLSTPPITIQPIVIAALTIADGQNSESTPAPR